MHKCDILLELDPDDLSNALVNAYRQTCDKIMGEFNYVLNQYMQYRHAMRLKTLATHKPLLYNWERDYFLALKSKTHYKNALINLQINSDILNIILDYIDKNTLLEYAYNTFPDYKIKPKQFLNLGQKVFTWY